jgi:general secretion pathway protein B
MSYILDALRKADAQRVRDPARGIHAQAVPAAAVVEAGGRKRGQWIWVCIAALIAAAAAWLWLDADQPPATVRPTASGVVDAATVPSPMAPVTPAPMPPAAAVLPAAPPVAVVAAPEPRRPPSRNADRPWQAAAAPAAQAGQAAQGSQATPTVAAPAIAAPSIAAPAASASASASASAAAAAVAPASPQSAAAERIYSLRELPPDVQQALPKFTVSGGVYSENVAQRMLIVNGQVFNEGSEIAPGVVLEQIRARVALLKFRGVRISQPY